MSRINQNEEMDAFNDDYSDALFIEKKKEKCSSFSKESYIKEAEYFGWQFSKEFRYKDGDLRLTFQRDKASEHYQVWFENENVFAFLRVLPYALKRIYEVTSSTNTSFKEISQEAEYRLSGVKKLFNIRSKEQKEDINRKVAEINGAYHKFNLELEATIKATEELMEQMKQELERDNTKLYSQSRYVAEIGEKYKIKYANGRTSCNLKGIEYSFATNQVELIEG